MALAKRPAAQYDGYKKHDLPVHSQTWQSAPRMRPVTIFRKRRLFIFLVVLVVVYLFIKYLPTDVPSVGQRIDVRTGTSQGRPFPFDIAPKKNSDGTSGDGAGVKQLYDGPVKFYHLASSLRPHLYKKEDTRENVVFMLHDLRTAASLTGLACEMALYNRTNVHIGLVAMQDASVEEIISVTGIRMEDCPVFWHDARPDYNSRSSLERQAIIVKAAISHLHATLKPTAVIIDQQQASNTRFRNALQDKLNSKWTPLSIVPDNALTSMSWITSLDGRALSLLNQNQIDIIIQPYKQSAGSLIRLLESIRSAHYANLPLPRITVELPHSIDSFALRYLENFHWPDDSPTSQSKLILRRRIDDKKLSPATGTLRTVELFYPPTTPNSHVLVLSPDVELSPVYLQYLYFLTLNYKYSTFNNRLTGSLMGISLSLPHKSLDEQTPFIVSNPPHDHPLILHQTPSAAATLYFGDQWVELQNYISLRLRHDPDLSKTISGSPESKISPDHPAWQKLAWELLQVRNRHILYPAFANTPEKELVTIHTESSQAPEEFWKEPQRQDDNTIPSLDDKTVLVGTGEAKSATAVHANMNHEIAHSSQSIQSLLHLNLKDRNVLPPLADLPLFTATGHATDRDTFRTESEKYADKISLELGDCANLDARDDNTVGQLEHLFCEE